MSMDTTYYKARQIFLEAVENHTPENWSAYIEAACSEDAELLTLVKDILTAHVADDALLDRGDVGERIQVSPDNLEPRKTRDVQLGDKIGPYELMEVIGSGGMGIVYRAKQTEPYERMVAVKLIRPEFDDAQMLAGLRREMQMLAKISHPNVATIFEGRTTDQGRSYFVMELVDGLPIHEYCDQYKLSKNGRVELFLRVCEAVHAVHKHGILHCDLKPDHILVKVVDGEPIPTLIDFGVAKKLLARNAARETQPIKTEARGTLEYMSPENISSTQSPLDSRSDVYSLGVLIYELLTGQTPVDAKRLVHASWSKVQQMVCEEEFVPPYNTSPRRRKSSMAGMGWSVLVSREKLLDLELNQMVMKALRKKPKERYASAGEFANDLQRFLKGEPISGLVRNPVYRTRKLLDKHRSLATVTTLVIMLLGIGQLAAYLSSKSDSSPDSYVANARRQAVVSEEKHRFLLEERVKRDSDAGTSLAELLLNHSALDVLVTKQPEIGWYLNCQLSGTLEMFGDWLRKQVALTPQDEFDLLLKYSRMQLQLNPSSDLSYEITRLEELKTLVTINPRDDVIYAWLRGYAAGQTDASGIALATFREQNRQGRVANEYRLELVGLELQRILLSEANENRHVSWLLGQLDTALSPSKAEWILSHHGISVLMDSGRYSEALSLAQRILERHSALEIGETHQILSIRRQYLHCCLHLARFQTAHTMVESNLNAAGKVVSGAYRLTTLCRLDHAHLLADLQRWNDARSVVENVLARLNSSGLEQEYMIRFAQQCLDQIDADERLRHDREKSERRDSEGL